MKSEQQDLARQLYIQGNNSKTDIAEKIGVNRRTVYQWSVDGDWDILRQSARCMPSILAQKVYHLIGHFTDNILCRESAYQSITKDEVNILTKLVNAVTKLKAGSTASENMETFTFFLEGLKANDPFLAEELLPHVDDFVTANATKSHKSFILDGHNPDGTKPFPDNEMTEKWLDEKDHEAILAEKENREPTPAQTYTPPADNPVRSTEGPLYQFKNGKIDYFNKPKTAAAPAKPTAGNGNTATSHTQPQKTAAAA